MSANGRYQAAQFGSALSCCGDGFGGVTSMMFASPVETLPGVPDGMVAMTESIPKMPYGNSGMGNEAQGGKTVHGMCGIDNCKHTAGTRGMKAHKKAKHPYWER